MKDGVQGCTSEWWPHRNWITCTFLPIFGSADRFMTCRGMSHDPLLIDLLTDAVVMVLWTYCFYNNFFYNAYSLYNALLLNSFIYSWFEMSISDLMVPVSDLKIPVFDFEVPVSDLGCPFLILRYHFHTYPFLKWWYPFLYFGCNCMIVRHACESGTCLVQFYVIGLLRD